MGKTVSDEPLSPASHCVVRGVVIVRVVCLLSLRWKRGMDSALTVLLVGDGSFANGPSHVVTSASAAFSAVGEPICQRLCAAGRTSRDWWKVVVIHSDVQDTAEPTEGSASRGLLPGRKVLFEEPDVIDLDDTTGGILPRMVDRIAENSIRRGGGVCGIELRVGTMSVDGLYHRRSLGGLPSCSEDKREMPHLIQLLAADASPLEVCLPERYATVRGAITQREVFA